MATSNVYLRNPCSKCQGTVGIFEDCSTVVADPFMISCKKCGRVFYKGDSVMEAARHFKIGSFGHKKTGKVVFGPTRQELEDAIDVGPGEVTEEHVETPPQYTMMQAYEANKKRNTCVACGKPTVLNRMLTPAFKYCPCVEHLPKTKCV